MLIRVVGRWLSTLAISATVAVAAASCGNSNGSTFVHPEIDAAAVPDGGGFGGFGDGGPGLGDDGGTSICVPKTCAQLGYDCGMNGDGCGGTLDCGSCPTGQSCGGGGYSLCGTPTGTQGDAGGGDAGQMVQCTPQTCQTLDINCGYAGDGCGGVLTCGSCTSPQYCGGGGYNKCGGNSALAPDGGSGCQPTTCATLGYTCGVAADGCGGVLNCGSCTNPQFCGGGGFDKCGGDNGLLADGGIPCTPTTCATLGYTCGIAADGCGGVLHCGTCTNPQYCGGGGFNQCGGNNGFLADGGVSCTPKTCGQLNYTCGITGDGCGGSLDCGSCTNPQYCGGGGFNQCGGNNGLTPDGGVACTPATCASLGYNCGQAADGCGGLLNCGGCTNPQFCGGGGYDTCGGNNGLNPDGGVACTPKTCAQLNYTCGAAGDGCGNLLNCGSCTAPQYCGGGGYDTCGPASVSVCDGGAATVVTGFVYDPANNLPINNALVYVPVGAVQVPQTGVNPATCGCTSPPALVSAFTNIDGSFTLSVPANASLTLVVQLGKWQRAFSETIVPCTTTALPSHLTLPSTHLQGHIPLFAVDTGNVDTMECVLRKMGIADSEFVDPAISKAGVPTATGRVHFYQGTNFAGGAVIDTGTPKESALTESATVMDSYDAILFPCQGGQANYTSKRGFPNTLGNLANFADNGGRVFSTHYSYTLLYTNGTATTGFKASANWSVNGGSWGGPFTGNIDNQSTFPRGQALANWLHQSNVVGGTLGQIPVNVIRNDFSGANAPAQEWVYTTNPPDQGLAHMDIHYTFDTPFTAGGPAGTCGRVVFSDFHVEDASNNQAKGKTFPNECAPGAMTAQEKLLEFMLFDLTSCVTPPACTPLTCAQQNLTCGPAGDGCGGQLNCGTCTSPKTCGGGGVSGQCGSPDAGSCTPRSCASQNISCGPAGDGCGGQLDCGTCTSPQTCGGGGVVGRCGFPEAGACQPQTCASQSISCGPAGDGCGNQINCGACTSPQTCGGGGVPGQCGYPDASSCVPTSCAAQKITCGPAGDGCGNLLGCGTCTAPASCGGGGVAGQCGTPDASVCAPLSCSQQNIGCGPAGDGCGNQLDCGSCAPPSTCGGGGVAGQCGYPDAGSCQPLSCAAQALNCGPAGDGCGNQIDCGTCPAGQACGGGGVPGQCGAPDSGSCSPTTCAQQNIACGPTGDGCGNLIQCGSCPAGQTCGGAGVAGQCGTPPGACVPLTCAQQGIGCGPAGDGCGNLIQCGSCVAPQTCGGGGTPGVCGTYIPR